MTADPYILWLDEVRLGHLPLVGGKAARLGEALYQGLPVPPGFCLTSRTYLGFVEAMGRRRQPAPATVELLQERLPLALQEAVRKAYLRLSRGGQAPLAVRSSASAEDLPQASFAGQGGTWLGVHTADALWEAILGCWLSLWSPAALAYRRDRGLSESDLAMPVLVQRQVDCEATGVAFSQDTLGRPEAVLVEAAWGLGEGVVSGRGEVDRFWIDRQTLRPLRPPQVGWKSHRWVPGGVGQAGLVRQAVPPPLQEVAALSEAQVSQAAALALALEGLFGAPQDVEFGLLDGDLFLLQSRPVTARYDPFFDRGPQGPQRLWSAGFLNERFHQPVSPLGWTLIQPLLEELAFREPLRYLGVHDLDQQAIMRLRRGHPYVDVGVFARLYKLFPDGLLPEDAARYFPDGDIRLRRQAPEPPGLWAPRLWRALLGAFWAQPALVSPWHNHRRWAAFEKQAVARLAALERERQAAADLPALWGLVTQAQELSRELLAVHRWSLTWADLLYTLLRRLAKALWGRERGAEAAAAAVADVETVSVRLNRALEGLAETCRAEGGLAALRGKGRAPRALAAFLEDYGHRSYSLDLHVPTFADDPSQVQALLLPLLDAQPQAPVGPPSAPPGARVLRPLVGLTRRYVRLREAQRFAWQRVLAFQRRTVLTMGKLWMEQGALPTAGHLFFATWDEVAEAAEGGAPLSAPRLASRLATFTRLCRDDAALPPSVAYPPFLRGNAPLQAGEPALQTLAGVVVSPGLAQGSARLVRSPADLAHIHSGDILVAPAVDPGWTPVFSRLGGLVLETGGQLSHGAVVAREYGLPALVGVSLATQRLHDGDLILLDAHVGEVRLLRGGLTPPGG
ncbi:MAG: hypothetical protein GX605_09680 [Chloroflexi bacterium]|nr:hypothetical protein [Chloroflexota bacterium]